MASIKLLRASDGTGSASVATVQSVRSAGATTLVVDTVENIPAYFMASMGTPHTFTDPVTSETITVISEATAVDFKGHVNSTNLEIDGIAPGFTDAGSAVGDIVIIKPTTEWADELADILDVSHNDDGTFKNDSINDDAMFADSVDPVKRLSEMAFNFIASGCVWSADSAGTNTHGSMTAGVVYIAGKRLTVAAASGHVFSNSKDTYVDFQDNGDGTASVTYTEATNNAASPAIPNSKTEPDNIRNAIIITGASSIADAAHINQGQETSVVPIASSIAYAVTDSLGNLINPRDPERRVLGYRQIISSIGPNATSTSDSAVTGLSCPVIVPSGRKIHIKHYCPGYSQTGGIGTVYAAMKVKEGATQLQSAACAPVGANIPTIGDSEVELTPSSGLHTYIAALANNSTGPNYTYGASSTGPAFIKVTLG